MKEGPKHGFVEIEEFPDSIIIEKDRNATILLQNLCDFMFFSFVLGKDTGPSYPDDLDHLSLFS